MRFGRCFYGNTGGLEPVGLVNDWAVLEPVTSLYPSHKHTLIVGYLMLVIGIPVRLAGHCFCGPLWETVYGWFETNQSMPCGFIDTRLGLKNFYSALAILITKPPSNRMSFLESAHFGITISI